MKSLTINGADIGKRVDGWYLDGSFDKILLPDIKNGSNAIELTCLYRLDMEIEDMHHIGDFGVDIHTRSIIGEPAKLHFGNWCAQGYPNYCGSMVYICTSSLWAYGTGKNRELFNGVNTFIGGYKMLETKTAIVTGGARGIGHSIAVQLAKEGFAVAVMDISPQESIEDNLSEIRAFGHSAFYYQGDLAVRVDRREFVEKVLIEYGRIDVLVNNAGAAPKVRADILDTTEESYDFVMDINLKGTFFLTQIIANEMIKQVRAQQERQPVIINISSISEYTSSPNRAEYCISKAGIGMLTKLFADRLSREGISVYGIRPGIIQTDMTKGVASKYDRLIDEGLLAVKLWGTPQDIADAVSVLCSGKLRYAAGQVLNIDGGFHMRRL